MWRAQYRASCLQDALCRVTSTVLTRRNAEVTEWALVATADLPLGTFLGFYAGDVSTEARESLYSAQVGRVYIYPFEDEARITAPQRAARPLACMNEPAEGACANCCMVVQDFLPDEVIGVGPPTARFYRGLACFTCKAVARGEPLTWHYGRSYEAHRRAQGYRAGAPCELLTQGAPFLPDASQGVLARMPRVSQECVWPVFGAQQSERLPSRRRKKKKKRGSDDDSDTDSSGSGHMPKYTPRAESRAERLQRRRLPVPHAPSTSLPLQ